VGGGVFVPVADGIEFAATAVDARDADEVAGAIVGVGCTVPVGESGVDVGDSDCGIAD